MMVLGGNAFVRPGQHAGAENRNGHENRKLVFVICFCFIVCWLLVSIYLTLVSGNVRSPLHCSHSTMELAGFLGSYFT